MSFSDEEEEELLPESVSNYYFVDEKEEPVSFCVLPFRWQDDQSADACKKQVFLHGVGDDGLQKIYKQVTEWKLELEGFRPVVFVLSKDQKWLQLSKPRKSYEEMIRRILITIHCLHYLRNNLESSEKSLWDHLKKEFSHFEVRPSRTDLQDHLAFIRELSQRDEAFAKCQLLPGLIDGASKKKPGSEDMMDTKNSDFINDEEEDQNEDGGNGNEDGADSDEEQDCFDSVCAICDNGGELTVCEGRCLRSFHAIKGVDTGSDCKTLGYTKAQMNAIPNFLCPNCRFKMHQCFACGKLGSSDRAAGAEVFPCVSATCGHFYHPKCVAKLLNAENEAEAVEQEKKIAAGEAFICPVHKCLVCKQGENKEVEELQFAMCRRCPRSYHRKCLPSEISFEDSDEDSDEESDIIVRAWDNLLPNRILIYCMKHKIDEDLGTPIRNHLKFPEDPNAPEKKRVTLLSASKTRVLGKKTGNDISEGQPVMKKQKLMRKASPDEENGAALNASASLPRLKKLKTSTKESDIALADKPSNMKSRLKAVNVREIESNKPSKSLLRDLLSSRAENASPSATAKKLISLPEIDSETQKRVIALARRSAASSLTLDMFIKQKEIPSTHAYSARHVDKTVTLGKVEGSIEAIQTALQKVKEDNGGIDNAKAVCEPGIVVQISRWRNKLGVYLSPFIHGLLYTSFGRHFTKVDKLREIVDRLHWYVQSGDTIVDFCCGANDFSKLMKEKLELTGKNCSYRNFDIIPPKNDFNFVKKDWMKVRMNELPNGSQLIMGLNPPFGVKGALANKFIDKALEFRPKLIILIVPKETERLDEKRGTRYDLIWEDDQKLSGKSFYMPGNVDVNDKLLEQWNVSPPPLYLWSRPDWTSTHMEIAKRYGHKGNKPVGESAAAVEVKIPAQETVNRFGSNGYMPVVEPTAAPVEIKIPSPVREEKPVQAAKVESSPKLEHVKAVGNTRENFADKKEPKSSRKSLKKQKKANVQEPMPDAKDAKGSGHPSISPRREDRRPEPIKEENKEEPPEEKARIQAANHEGAFDKIIRYTDYSNERISMLEDKYRPRTPAEVGYPLGSALASNSPSAEGIYGARTSEERFPGYGVDGGLGFLDRPREDLLSDVRRYGQPRTADLLGDIRSYGLPSSTYAAPVSAARGYSDSGIGSSVTDKYAPRLGGDSGLGSSVTDKYASRLGELGPGLPGSSLIGTSAIDRYAPPRLDEITYVRRNSGTSYGTPGAWSGAVPPRDSPPFPPGSRFPPSGRPQ